MKNKPPQVTKHLFQDTGWDIIASTSGPPSLPLLQIIITITPVQAKGRANQRPCERTEHEFSKREREMGCKVRKFMKDNGAKPL